MVAPEEECEAEGLACNGLGEIGALGRYGCVGCIMGGPHCAEITPFSHQCNGLAVRWENCVGKNPLRGCQCYFRMFLRAMDER